ncbi:MAG TPA: double-strand break repair helicase AddA [Caulobacteraceae bacterium]|nr:double-strand break repair helicase AddA [Caulobacteraceae bacterium]
MTGAPTRGVSQIEASDPRASVFVPANAGSGKTFTLVKRVTRLLLAGAAPEAILCVTFTKAGAAEMQRRLFAELGALAISDDPALAKALAAIDEAGQDFSKARALFARALETPGGLKIQTIHAFCEKLLRRFPIEAGVAPGFRVLEDAAAAEISAKARDELAEAALDDPDGAVAMAYDHLSVQLDYRSFNTMFGDFEAKRSAIAAYIETCRQKAVTVDMDVWGRCGFAEPSSVAATEAWAMQRSRGPRWRRAAHALMASGNISDRSLGATMLAIQEGGTFADLRAVFCNKDGAAKVRVATSAVAKDVRDWLAQEQSHYLRAAGQVAAARLAEETVQVLHLARAYGARYEVAKAQAAALDFGDLIERTVELLTRRADAAWVLYKLDNGLEHVLLDEAQDTAPEQWSILRELTGEFFHGQGSNNRRRTMFAVGDEKQSIFSFQGADPKHFAIELAAFDAMVSAAGQRFRRIPLLESWRSAPEILAFVDQVFSDGEALAGVRSAGPSVEALDLRHVPLREPGGGVELWPLQAGETSDGDIDPWAPVDREPARSANKLLAARIAAAIAQMVARGEAVLDRQTRTSRACRFGDVMILVRRRNTLFHEIIRALKREGVPVAGADRLKLAEHGVFADLMALGRFIRFPDDDLALAGLLRGPFCEVDEAGLFDLAYDRQGSLWRNLQARAPEQATWSEAHRFLAWAREAAERAAPFDFYCAVLGRIDAAGRSMRQRILTRLKAEGEQALDAFVAQVLAAEASGVRDLESLLAWMAALDLDIKREQDEGQGGEVRVMTVHGAKGLEAPIVFLPDTTSKATWQGGRLLETPDGGFLWAPSRKGDDAPASAGPRAARDLAVAHESSRLLYVALTRARDRLIVAGVAMGNRRTGLDEGSWYDFVQRAFAGLEARACELPGGGNGLRYGADPTPGAPAAAEPAPPPDPPDWTRGLAPAEAVAALGVAPSRLEDDAGKAPSPLASVGGLGRYRRGDLIHRLLQLLPDLPEAARPDGATRLLAREPDLTAAQRDEMALAALTVLADRRFAAVFGEGSRAEVPLVGGAARLPPDFTVSGRVDRLLVQAERVLVVDFKTNRPPPARIEDADPAYLRQMAIYWAILSEVYPGRRIEAALLWTDGPSLMDVPAALMDRALAQLTASR